MLGKLIKHEFRATGRLMAPLFGALLLLAVFSRVTNQILQQVPNPTRVLYIVSVLLAIVYVLAGLGVMVFSTVLMIKRFHQNFLTDEGYLMFTLPVSVHSLLWSKLITAALFFLFTFAAELLSIAPLCRTLTLAIETDANAAPDGRLFAPVNFSLQRLERLAKERGIAVERETLDAELDAPWDIRLMEKRM